MTVDTMLWVTHGLALFAGVTLGVAVMSWVQVNRLDRYYNDNYPWHDDERRPR
jgi:hypothetical protein